MQILYNCGIQVIEHSLLQMAIDSTLNIWTTSFLVTAIIGIFFGCVLVFNRKGKRNVSSLTIGVLIIGFSFVLMHYISVWSGYRDEYPYLFFFDYTWYFLFGPLFYVSIVKLYNPKFNISIYHFMPSAISFMLTFLYYIRSNGFKNLRDFDDEVFFYYFTSFRSPWVIIFSLIFYNILIDDFIKNFKRGSSDSQLELMRSKFVKILQFLFIFFLISFLSYFVLVKFSFFNREWDYSISISMCISIYAIGYFVYKKNEIQNGEFLSSIFLSRQEKDKGLSDITKKELFDFLLIFIKTEKIYLDNDLKLVKLADEVKLSSHLLSELINEFTDKNFNQFINDYRLKEAINLLEKNENDSIKQVYYNAGFNSKSTFYKVFKEKFKCSPMEYKEYIKHREFSCPDL